MSKLPVLLFCFEADKPAVDHRTQYGQGPQNNHGPFTFFHLVILLIYYVIGFSLFRLVSPEPGCLHHFQNPCTQHITPALKQLHWLLVCLGIVFKVLLFISKALLLPHTSLNSLKHTHSPVHSGPPLPPLLPVFPPWIQIF